jgi:hypothetical protein
MRDREGDGPARRLPLLNCGTLHPICDIIYLPVQL